MSKKSPNTPPDLTGLENLSGLNGATPAGDEAGRAEAITPPDTLAYRVISPLHHDGVVYQIGDTVELSGPTASALIGLRVVEPAQ